MIRKGKFQLFRSPILAPSLSNSTDVIIRAHSHLPNPTPRPTPILNDSVNKVVDLHRQISDASPLQPNFLYFHAVFRTFWPNNRLVTPPLSLGLVPLLGNPGSDTGMELCNGSLTLRGSATGVKLGIGKNGKESNCPGPDP